jgi:hypothetical protein
MNYPQRWFWQNGRLTNELDGGREFLYLHFMRWQSPRWINDPPLPGEAAWPKLSNIVNMDWRRAGIEGFCIGLDGICPITAATPDAPSACAPWHIVRNTNL